LVVRRVPKTYNICKRLELQVPSVNIS